MKQSVRARRMARHHRRHKNSPGLNLVSLMDIFTILVFFLLVNSSHVQVLQADSSLDLPTSNAEQLPDEQLVVMVTTDDILVAGRRVARVAEIDSDATTIPGLAEELNFRRERERPLDEAGQARGYPITIMGDQQIPYRLLRSIMTTCAEVGYRDISLAVAQATEGGEP